MHAAVTLLYIEGRKAQRRRSPLVGQVVTRWHREVHTLVLWPMEWTASAGVARAPLATLYRPALVRMGHDDLMIRGMERCHDRWCAQSWLVDVLDRARAEALLLPDRRVGVVMPSR
ncbi:hypothetical protein GHT07_12000 [Caenimonas koreensis DSM 17982]|uniref:Uncharacterized protein n=1 Tax=Caenimonas koreensis DSM 17982 TaxID=1121255 RepID=A0A844B956_9BURK|nr:hypothetical protein [Caenimonas koreensis]MRD48006.1 hypothetical protein [Caenimonas koreensis DSM 17982]